MTVVNFMRMIGFLFLIIQMFSYKATPMRGVEGTLELKLSFDKNQLPLRSRCFSLLRDMYLAGFSRLGIGHTEAGLGCLD